MTTYVQKDTSNILLEEELARALILTHWIAYATTGPDGVINLTSENFWALQSDSSSIAVGCTLPEVLWEFIGIEHILDEILRGERAIFKLNRIVRPMLNDQVQYINLQVVGLSEVNPGSGLLLIIEDISTVGQLEQAVTQERNHLLLTKNILTETNQKLTRLDRYKSAMVAMAAQDIQAALKASHEFAQRILTSLTEEEVRENAQSILYQTQYALQLIKDLVELDQIERGVSSLKITNCDLQSVLQEIIETMRPIATARQQILTLANGVPTVMIQADVHRLNQALYRLISAATHFSPPETHIHCDMLYQEQKTSFPERYAVVQISTQPTHMGNPLPTIEHDTLTTWDSSHESSGLMAEWFLARRLVEVQGGHAVISLKHGVVFAVYIPLQ